MKLRWSDLWSWEGAIGRLPYLMWGAILVAIKFNLDRMVMRLAFDRDWTPAHYFSAIVPPGGAIRLENFGPESVTLLLISLPFLWTGIGLSLRRLRAAGLPSELVILFVVPWVKWLLFTGLVAVPDDANAAASEAPSRQPHESWLDRIVPRSRIAVAALAVLIPVSVSLGTVALGVWVWAAYGWTIFVGLPFVTGFLAAVIYGHHERRSLGACVAAAWLSVVVTAVAILLFAFEGIICLAMAAPIALLIATIGGTAGYAIQAARRRPTATRLGGALVAIPLLFALEHGRTPAAPLLEVSTTIEVNAPPAVVWQHVVTFAELPAPTEWLFRTGLAYPVRATIDGTGPDAIRRCEFSTGPFVEPIEVWDEPRLLRFGVTHNPPPMQEWTFYDEIHPPHLNGFLASERGQFELTALPDGRTRLTGTTWYRHHMQPARYWQLWSDYIIHRIHLRVLRHVKHLAESETVLRPTAPAL